MTEPLETTLLRLRTERDAADERYNETLTALDQARPAPPALADPPLALDGARLAELNAAWNILPAEPAASGIRGRLAGFIWRTIGPYLQRQLTFNSVIVDHINRNADAQTRAHQAAEELARELRTFHAQVGALHTRLMMYLQQITAYVDTRDRQAGAGALVLNAAISEVAEAQAKYRETIEAREHRHRTRAEVLAAAHEELRAMMGVAQHAIASLRRHLESGSVGPLVPGSVSPQVAASDQAFAPSLDSYKYVGFEDQFRGSRDAIRARQETYVPLFAGVTGDVLDVGCGRGEFIELLNASGIGARGIDLNHEMAESCRARGLNVVQADAVGYLTSVEDGSLGGIFAAQVVEHLEPSYLLRFLDLAFARLQPGGTLVLETLNPACWTAFFESYIRDITHRWPLHPETLKYLVTASGFTRVDVHFLSPMPAADRLQSIPATAGASAELQDLVETCNANAEKLNARMFSHMDFAVVARKTHEPGTNY
jgi:SAM-dependent methyltransferase